MNSFTVFKNNNGRRSSENGESTHDRRAWTLDCECVTVVSVLQCVWSGEPCDSSWFTPVTTQMGYCFAFNAGNAALYTAHVMERTL